MGGDFLNYDKKYQKNIEKVKKDEWRVKMFNIVKKMCKRHILELGCGVNPLFKNSTKIDIYPLKDSIVSDLNKKFPLEDNLFDTVVSTDVIEHLYDINNFLSEIHRVLKKGGKVIISTPNAISWRNRLFLLFGKNPFIEQYEMTGHIVFLDYKNLEKKLKESGFKNIELKPMGNVKILSICGEILAIAEK